MAKATIAIDPVTRIEGHLKAQVVVENGKVVVLKAGRKYTVAGQRME